MDWGPILTIGELNALYCKDMEPFRSNPNDWGPIRKDWGVLMPLPTGRLMEEYCEDNAIRVNLEAMAMIMKYKIYLELEENKEKNNGPWGRLSHKSYTEWAERDVMEVDEWLVEQTK